jgi:hypothetical protein
MKKHTLRHGMTVRKPSHEDIDAIRDAAELAGIECEGFQFVKSGSYPNLWYYGACEPQERCITACVEVGDGRVDVKFMSADRFIEHINGKRQAK